MSFAFAIPVHPPKYNYIYELINKYQFNRIDLFLIFSNNSDYESFLHKDRIIPIILPDNIHTGNIVTYKKFYALQYILMHQGYDYFIVCDSEISLVYENFNVHNMLEKLHNFFENRLIYAGETNNDTIYNILKSSNEVFYDQNNILKINEITNNNRLISWWSEIPFYKRSHLENFFSKFNYSNINWNHFDHIIYTNYLLLYEGFMIVNLTDIIGLNYSLECYYTDNIDNLYILKGHKYLFSWSTIRLFDRFKDFFLENKTLLIYHLDRN